MQRHKMRSLRALLHQNCGEAFSLKSRIPLNWASTHVPCRQREQRLCFRKLAKEGLLATTTAL